MGANWVEVAQKRHLEFWIGDGEVLHDLFNHVLGATIRVRNASASNHSFDVFWGFLNAINGSGRREDNLLAVMCAHGLQEIDGAFEVGFVVAQRLLDGFADGLEASEVDYEVEVAFGEELVDLVGLE